LNLYLKFLPKKAFHIYILRLVLTYSKNQRVEKIVRDYAFRKKNPLVFFKI